MVEKLLYDAVLNIYAGLRAGIRNSVSHVHDGGGGLYVLTVFDIVLISSFFILFVVISCPRVRIGL